MLTHIHRNCNALAQPCISHSASADVHPCHPVFCAQLRLHADCNSVLWVRLPSPRVARNENDADFECLEPAALIKRAKEMASNIATWWCRKLATMVVSCWYCAEKVTSERGALVARLPRQLFNGRWWWWRCSPEIDLSTSLLRCLLPPPPGADLI